MVIIGHRGAMGYEPENTIRSFKKAIEDGVDMIEFDVQLLRSGELVVIHDTTVDRTTDGHGNVSDMTFDQIRKLDAGKGEKIPTLQEVLNEIDRKVPVIIEMTGFLDCTKKLAEILKVYVNEKNWQYSDFMVSSFIQKDLMVMKSLVPEIRLGVNFSAIPYKSANYIKDLHVDFVASEHLYWRDENPIQEFHSLGVKLYIYSINNIDYFSRFQKYDIDGFFTNWPNRIKH